MADTLPSESGPSAVAPVPAPARVSALDTFSVPSFGLIWLSGLIWHLSRWGVSFLGSVVINDLTHSPRLVQLGGSLLYAPLLVGGVAGGLVSDRFDRLRTVRVQLAVIVPLTVAIGALAATDRLQVWMLYLYMFMVGIGWVTDMTSRRAMVFDIVGPQRMGNAMALESLSLSSGAVIGPLVGGTALKAIGTGPSYYVIAAMVTVAFVVLLPVRRPAPEAANRPTTPARPIQDLRD
ncbi:MAG: MFS transporter, partial [Acidimicrobiia bacterium]|nr:MFS transporter [Acidimicrobiia bacterium]